MEKIQNGFAFSSHDFLTCKVSFNELLDNFVDELEFWQNFESSKNLSYARKAERDVFFQKSFDGKKVDTWGERVGNAFELWEHMYLNMLPMFENKHFDTALIPQIVFLDVKAGECTFLNKKTLDANKWEFLAQKWQNNDFNISEEDANFLGLDFGGTLEALGEYGARAGVDVGEGCLIRHEFSTVLN